MKRISLAALLLVTLAGASSAQTIYNGQFSHTAHADFLAAVGATGVADFQDRNTSFTLTNGFGTGTSSIGDFTCGATGCFSITGVASGYGSATFTFSQEHNAFGADFADLNNCCGDYIGLTFFNGETNVGTWATHFPAWESYFFGVSGLPSFDGVVVDITNGEYFEIDNVEVGATAAPEPATFILLATGLLGVFGIARRRNA